MQKKKPKKMKLNLSKPMRGQNAGRCVLLTKKEVVKM
jgi:hypothetical protein